MIGCLVRVGRLPRLLALLLAVLVVVVACTDASDSDDAADGDEDEQPEPVEDSASIPPRGMRMAIVVPSTDEVDEPLQQSLADELRGLEQVSPDLRQLRVDVANGHQFVPDLAQLHAERGFDLVCVLGGQGPLVVSELVEQYGGVQFCAPSPSPAPSDEIDDEESWPGALGVRVEELGHVMGVAARVASEGELVAMVLSGDDVPQYRFRSGLAAGLADNPAVDVTEGESMSERARAAVDEGAEVVVIDGGPGAADAVAEVAGEVAVLAPRAVAEAASGEVLVAWEVDWVAVLAAATELWTDADELDGVKLGLGEEVFGIETDLSGVTDEVGEDVERAIRVSSRELVAGEREAAEPDDD